MLKLNFPDFEFKLKNRDNKTYIFDIIRKKFILLTPEEWVRQHVVKLLIENGVSKNHIGVEKKIIVNKLSKRFDVVAFDRNGLVKMLVECKAPSINIDQKVFDLTLIYNKNLNSDYIMITNGIMHFIFKINIQDKSYDFINEFPII